MSKFVYFWLLLSISSYTIISQWLLFLFFLYNLLLFCNLSIYKFIANKLWNVFLSKFYTFLRIIIVILLFLYVYISLCLHFVSRTKYFLHFETSSFIFIMLQLDFQIVILKFKSYLSKLFQIIYDLFYTSINVIYIYISFQNFLTFFFYYFIYFFAGPNMYLGFLNFISFYVFTLLFFLTCFHFFIFIFFLFTLQIILF
jgi:hypothetical protein